MDEETEEERKANMLKIEQKSSEGIVESFPDECETPSPPAGPVPIPYPNTAKSSDTSSGSKTVKTEGKEVLQESKSDFKKSSGDETGSSDGKSEEGTLEQIATTKVFRVPLWIWCLLIVAVLVAILILASNMPHPIEPIE